jgi:uncharacterized membrane protein YraQ (UPF0718 family)
MFAQVTAIANFIVAAFIHIWPYLLVTIPLAVAVRMSGASKYINDAFKTRPTIAILLATFVGAFSPFCSCGVIPVIAALLMSGVPLAPVMSFWIASPSMDPEIFFLSVSTIGWELAVWRLGGTLVLSLSAGFLTHFIVGRGWLGQGSLRQPSTDSSLTARELLNRSWQTLKRSLQSLPPLQLAVRGPVSVTGLACCAASAPVAAGPGDGTRPDTASVAPSIANDATCGSAESNSCTVERTSFRRRLLKETWGATQMVAKFMALAFFLEALITLYVPETWIAGMLGHSNPWAILTAAFLGVPVYTSNMAALPMVSGLLEQGMNPAAGLAFLIAGPTTTLPAMAAVWGLTSRRVFALYVSFSLAGAVVLGYIYGLLA